MGGATPAQGDRLLFYFNGFDSAIARFRAFEGGSHSFEHVQEALADFAAARGATPG